MQTSRQRQFDTLVAPHLETLFRVAYRLVRNTADAQDPVQDTCMTACTSLEALAAADSPLAWLLRVHDPAVAQPLLQALKNDPDKSARYQGVQMARKFLDVPGVRETLLEIAASDPDGQPEVFCCAQTVREAAERAAVTDADFLAWARRRLMDDTLPSRSRLITLMGFSSDGRFVGNIANIGPDAAGVVLDVGQRDPDLRVRAMAWDILYMGQADKAFVAREVVPVVLEDLRHSPNERVRAGAARILSGYTDTAGVREALESARDDASIMVRRAALGEGGGPVSAE